MDNLHDIRPCVVAVAAEVSVAAATVDVSQGANKRYSIAVHLARVVITVSSLQRLRHLVRQACS